jgi:hypothetical protein
MTIIEEYRESIKKERALRELLFELDKQNKSYNEKLMRLVGQEILEKRLLIEHSWVLGIDAGFSKKMYITLETDKLTPEMNDYIVDLDEQEVYWFLHDIPLQDSGWFLHMRRRGADGMRLIYPFEKVEYSEVNVTEIMKKAFWFGVAKVRTGSLRSTYYQIRKNADQYENIIKRTEGVFK